MSTSNFDKRTPFKVAKRIDGRPTGTVNLPASNTDSTPTSTSSTPSSTTTPPSSSTPPTSSTPSSTSSTTQQSISTTPSSSSSNTASSNPSSSISSTQSIDTSSTPTTSTAVQTTVITTNAQGSTVTVQTTAIPSSIPSIAPTQHNSTNSHIGPIVGGTVGGITAIAILGLLLFYCLRRQRRKDDFDGNFDPDRVGHNQGPLDLTAGEVEPYTFPQETDGHGQVDMREGPRPVGAMHQYYNNSPNAQHDYEDSRSPTDTHTTTSYLSPNAVPMAGAGLAYAPSSSTSLTPPRSAKEREAYSRFNAPGSSGGMSGEAGGSAEPGLRVMNQQDEDVVVHQDGGRIRIPVDDEPVEREIPPTYDSIPPDDSRR